MTPREVLRTRLQNQRLDEPGFKTPGEMVKYFGAVQAQDYLGALWAVGQRTIDATEQSVEAAIAGKKIVRSWPMRGTLHFTAPEDLRWMLDLLAERTFAKSAPHERDAGLTEKDFVKSRKVIEKEMPGKILTRNELYDVLKSNRIDPSASRGLHIIGHLARQKVLCFGPRSGKQPTFVLLDEWIPEKKVLTKDEALAELASRYFTSHAPATVQDFAWWAGLTITEATRAYDLISSSLQQSAIPNKIKNPVRFLAAYDEFLVGYTNREDTNSIFDSNVIVNGHVAGAWKRTITNKGVQIKIQAYEKISEAGIRKEMKRYAKFVGLKLLS